jgi:hypothetical protein
MLFASRFMIQTPHIRTISASLSRCCDPTVEPETEQEKEEGMWLFEIMSATPRVRDVALLQLVVSFQHSAISLTGEASLFTG